MQDVSNPGQRIAALLLEAGCVSVRGEEPFRLPSGWASPVYIDCRRLIAFPNARKQIVLACVDKLHDSGVAPKIEGIVAGESSGIAYGAWVAEHLNLPLHYVRKSARGSRQVEGNLTSGQKVLLVDDMMAGGTSKSNFFRAIATMGATVEDLLVIFDYATFGAERSLLQQGVRTHSLATWADVLQVAQTRGLFVRRSLDDLADFLSAPSEWSRQHGGLGA